MEDALFDLSGRVALVTGASRGLGQYFGRALARAGADLAITSREAEALTGFADEIRSLGRKAGDAPPPISIHRSTPCSLDSLLELAG